MKSVTLLRLLGVLALLISLAGIPLYAQQAGQQPGSQEPAQSQSSMGQQQSTQGQSQTFMGKISKSKGDLVLKDDAGTSYKLDNADQAKQWVGKSVKVTGTLDATTNTIHVTNIEAPSS
jgi:hypothetical protein